MRYTSSIQHEFINHADRASQIETTAQIVGVERGDTTFQKPIPPAEIAKINGTEADPEAIREYETAIQAQADHLAFLNAEAQK